VGKEKSRKRKEGHRKRTNIENTMWDDQKPGGMQGGFRRQVSRFNHKKKINAGEGGECRRKKDPCGAPRRKGSTHKRVHETPKGVKKGGMEQDTEPFKNKNRYS